MPRSEQFLQKPLLPHVGYVFFLSEFWNLRAMNVMTKLMEECVRQIELANQGYCEYPGLRSLEDLVHEHLDPCPLTPVSGVV